MNWSCQKVLMDSSKKKRYFFYLECFIWPHFFQRVMQELLRIILQLIFSPQVEWPLPFDIQWVESIFINPMNYVEVITSIHFEVLTLMQLTQDFLLSYINVRRQKIKGKSFIFASKKDFTASERIFFKRKLRRIKKDESALLSSFLYFLNAFFDSNGMMLFRAGFGR